MVDVYSRTMDIDYNEHDSSIAYLKDEDTEESEDELMRDDVDGVEEVFFDFEAFPLSDSDKNGIVDMLTQIFLRVDIDVNDMANALIRQSPFGCIFRPADDYIDEDNENIVFGIVSLIELGNTKKFENDIWNLLKARAGKYALNENIISRLEKLSSYSGGIRVGLLINERMLHFPSSIAAPAFDSLKNDIAASGTRYRFDVIITIQKIRIADVAKQQLGQDTGGKKKKKGKAAKKRAAAAALKSADVIFDNPEEEVLYSADIAESEGGIFDYFQYPVQSDVEKESKFNSTVVGGITYRPYRRVCLMDANRFSRFIDVASNQNSSK
uniref:Protein BCCIP homolog n=1 Tax=Parascaris univalens TaxID=6257 RepID=A0A915A4Y9_PARUN